MKSEWSSRMTFIMAATGAAVGLGNIWKFPYMAGENGGGAFVLLYLIFVIFIGVPILMGEMVIGRLGKENAISSLAHLAKRSNASPYWQYLGWWGAFALVLVLSFYSVVAGWSIGYLVQMWTGGFGDNLSAIVVQNYWEAFISDPYNLLLWHTLFISLTLGVVVLGVKEGLEKAIKILMPGLFLVLIILFFYSANVGDLTGAMDFLLNPHFSALDASAVIYALGHAFFTLALGAGAMLVYGSYLPKDTKLGSSVSIVAALDVLVAICSGLSIFAIVFAYQLTPAGGAGLMFQVLPIAFGKMPLGQWFGGLFFILLWVAAWASSLSMAEPLVMLCMERFNLSRKNAAFMIGLLCWALGLLALLSFNVLKDFKLFGHFTFFTLMTDLTTNILLPIGGLGFAIFAGWILNPKEVKAGLRLESEGLFRVWQFLIRYVAPVGIIATFIGNVF